MQAESNGHAGLTREQILNALDLKIEAVDIPEWGGTVYIRNMTGKARDAFESSRYKMIDGKVEVNQINTRAALLACSLCDPQGALLFSPQDIEALGDKNGAILDRLFDVAQRLSGMRTEAMEERLKNLRSAPSVSSGTS